MDDNFSTMLTVRNGERILSSSGMAGPKLYGDDLVNASYGITDDQPCVEVIRAHPSVDRVVITTDRGAEIEAELTAARPAFGLRFGAARLPVGHLPLELRAESSGRVVYREAQHGLRRLPPGNRRGFRGEA